MILNSGSLTGDSAPPRNERRAMVTAVFAFLAGVSLLWLCFEWIFDRFPYLVSGADVIYQAKLTQETHAQIFPPDHKALHVLLFGSSKALAGFIPSEFDRLANHDGVKAYSYNSGYPARTEFLPQLKQIVAHGQIPDVLILTESWGPAPDRKTFFRFLIDDHATASELFPFRGLFRDALNFFLLAKANGGAARFYAKSKQLAAQMRKDRGYFFIAEQSRFPGNHLPADFRLPTDEPNKAYGRQADPRSPELPELNALVRQHRIACYFVPFYSRIGERMTPPPEDAAFLEALRDSRSPCQNLGPAYTLYKPELFSDQMHLNPEGAELYTRDVYAAVTDELKRKQDRALQ